MIERKRKMAETRGSGHVGTLWLVRGRSAPGTQRRSAHAGTLQLMRGCFGSRGRATSVPRGVQLVACATLTRSVDRLVDLGGSIT
jgi:hypothetical protein